MLAVRDAESASSHSFRAMVRVSDVHLPGHGGIELASRARAVILDLDVVLMSGDAAARASAERLGTKSLGKLLDLESLGQLLERRLDART